MEVYEVPAVRKQTGDAPCALSANSFTFAHERTDSHHRLWFTVYATHCPRVRELIVYCEFHPYNHRSPLTPAVKGSILSQPVRSVPTPRRHPDLSLVLAALPLLGIVTAPSCWATSTAADVRPSSSRSTAGPASTRLTLGRRCCKICRPTQVWMSHGDTITESAGLI
jgi:GMP synthase-like glutamine amidotransferase